MCVYVLRGREIVNLGEEESERVWGWTECVWGPSGLGQAPSNSESVQGEATSIR